MERPRCKTCIHFACLRCMAPPTEDISCVVGLDGKPCHDTTVCTRYPKSHGYVDEGIGGFLSVYPEHEPDEYCGEHQNFPAYVASLEPRPPEANLSPGEKVKAALLNLDEGDEIMARMLTPRELEIMRLAFGFGEGRVPYTLDEIARIFKVTMPRVRQIHDKAVGKLSLLREVRDASLIPLDSRA